MVGWVALRTEDQQAISMWQGGWTMWVAVGQEAGRVDNRGVWSYVYSRVGR